jgi:putative ABC transport system ATP-binding protein
MARDSNNSRPLIRIDDVSKIYHHSKPAEVRALQNISLEILQGEVVALTGPSGSGKSTLLSLIGCMSRPTQGTIYLDERRVSRLPEAFLARIRRETYGFVFQQYHLLRDVSVLDNLMFPLYPAAMPFSAMRERALVLLEKFSLTNKQKTKVRQLSGGEQQRVALARALMADPPIIIADEPTAHLDAELASELLRILTELQAEGRTIIIATHDPVVYQSPLISRRVALRHGKLVDDEKAGSHSDPPSGYSRSAVRFNPDSADVVGGRCGGAADYALLEQRQRFCDPVATGTADLAGIDPA